MDFKGNPFGPMPALMATAEYVTKVHAICTRTGNLAHYSFRKNDNDKLVMLGETEEYEPLSRAAYYNAMRKDEKNSESQKTIIRTNHDAHIYIKDLIGKGVRHFVVTHIPNGLEDKANFLVVKNTLEALQQI